MPCPHPPPGCIRSGLVFWVCAWRSAVAPLFCFLCRVGQAAAGCDRRVDGVPAATGDLEEFKIHPMPKRQRGFPPTEDKSYLTPYDPSGAPVPGCSWKGYL